ncbi:potassium channel family protein [Bradyrhizobium genosp. P]|uniref:potassium channel family protein n=1 Tax=Bradyrhizobium genosp. P TaxID=83641 RepID=UPI003CED4D40
MIFQLIVGSCVAGINIVIHAVLTVATIRAARASSSTSHPWRHLIGVMTATVLILMAAHTLEVVVWSAAYSVIGVATDGADLVYFAFVNYTTLGYGDITPVARWRLIGPITAMNGVLLFGWSTAVIFEVLRKALAQHASLASS